MTPTQVLEEAKGRFVVLYHKDPVALARLLKTALGKYQDKAGVIGRFKIQEGENGFAPLPPDFLDVVYANDSAGNYVDAQQETVDAIDGIKIDYDGKRYPVTVQYMMNLRDWPLDKDLPAGVAGILIDYLVALIDLPNSKREASASAQQGLQVELLSVTELQGKIEAIEMAMEDSRAILMPIMVW